MVERVRSGGQPRTNGWDSSTSRACGWKLSMADSPGNRSTTTAVSTSSWPVGKRAAWPSRQRQRTFPHTRAAESHRAYRQASSLFFVPVVAAERAERNGERGPVCFAYLLDAA